jgi:hypothetical protein
MGGAVGCSTKPKGGQDESDGALLRGQQELQACVGKHVVVRGIAEVDKDSPVLVTSFYRFQVIDLEVWPTDVVGNRVVVTGVLVKEAGFKVPVEDTGGQSRYMPGESVPEQYKLKNISWVTDQGHKK